MTRWGKPLDEAYFKWLTAPFADSDSGISTGQLQLLYSSPFEYFVHNDRNRARNGQALRDEFLYQYPEHGSDPGLDTWMGLECSVLEMLQALCEAIAYQTSGDAADWFFKLVDNWGIGHTIDETAAAIKRLNERSYSKSGKGGLFPLRHPLEDQRVVEIWYQMSAYLIENDDWRDGA